MMKTCRMNRCRSRCWIMTHTVTTMPLAKSTSTSTHCSVARRPQSSLAGSLFMTLYTVLFHPTHTYTHQSQTHTHPHTPTPVTNTHTHTHTSHKHTHTHTSHKHTPVTNTHRQMTECVRMRY